MFSKNALTKDRLTFIFPKSFLVFLACWGGINVLQSIFTEVGEDEAYYYVYSKYPDWGYFDHPPMISLFIKAGTWFLDGEIGLRVMTILAQLVCLCLIWLVIDDQHPTRKRITLFFIIASSVVMFQVFGFMATPDSPLLLFTAFFLFAYKLFLQEERVEHILLLSLAMAGLIYAKYHGGLIIIFILLSNPKLLKSYRFWIAGFLALLLFVPHMIWQIQNDFPSFQFHLVSRSGGFRIKNLINFFPNQFANFNPFFLFLFLFLAIKFKAQNTFERGLYFITGGFFTFFFLSALRGHVEPHWTIAASIPMIILIYHRTTHHDKSWKYINRVLLSSVILIMLLRIGLAADLFPARLGFQGKEEYYMHLDSIVGDKPVIFESTYQKPSLYTFFTQKPSTSINGLSYRKNQYDLWAFESDFFNREVTVVTNRWEDRGQPYIFPGGQTVFLLEVDSFISVQKVEIKPDDKPAIFKQGDTISIHGTISNPYPHDINFKNTVSPVAVIAYFSLKGKEAASIPIMTSPEINTLKGKQSIPVTFKFTIPDLPENKYQFGITLKAGSFQKTFNSTFWNVSLID